MGEKCQLLPLRANRLGAAFSAGVFSQSPWAYNAVKTLRNWTAIRIFAILSMTASIKRWHPWNNIRKMTNRVLLPRKKTPFLWGNVVGNMRMCLGSCHCFTVLEISPFILSAPLFLFVHPDAQWNMWGGAAILYSELNWQSRVEKHPWLFLKEKIFKSLSSREFKILWDFWGE